MMLSANVIACLQGKTLSVAESCTGGMIGACLTSVPGSSAVLKGGVISYTNAVKEKQLGVSCELLDNFGAVSKQVAEAMASGVRNSFETDVAVSVTGLAGPGGDEYGNPVGTVFIGYCDESCCICREFHFAGDRDFVRQQAVSEALTMVLEHNR